MDWKMILGVGFWWVLDLSIIAGLVIWVRTFLWRPFLDYFDLNKESNRNPKRSPPFPLEWLGERWFCLFPISPLYSPPTAGAGRPQAHERKQ